MDRPLGPEDHRFTAYFCGSSRSFAPGMDNPDGPMCTRRVSTRLCLGGPAGTAVFLGVPGQPPERPAGPAKRTALRRKIAGMSGCTPQKTRQHYVPGSGAGLGFDQHQDRVRAYAVEFHGVGRCLGFHHSLERIHVRDFDDQADAVGFRRVDKGSNSHSHRSEEFLASRRAEPVVNVVDLMEDQ